MDERDIARRARAAEDVYGALNLKLTIGFLVGAGIGLLVGAYIILPMAEDTWYGVLGALAAILLGGWLGRRLVLEALSG